MLLLSVLLALQTPVDSVAIVTRDIPNFWRAYDQAAGKDSAERVRIFETAYLQPGSPGLRDWMRVRLMNRDTVRARLARAGWPKARHDRAERHADRHRAECERPRYAARRAARLGAEEFSHAYVRIARRARRARGGAHPAEARARGPARHAAAPRARRRHRRFPRRARRGTVGCQFPAPDLRPR